jgi:hypothetical protein
MFWFFSGPSRSDAQRTADEFMLYRGLVLGCKSCNTLAEKIRQRHDELCCVDQMTKICVWFGAEKNFAYHACFGASGNDRKLIALGRRNFSGIMLSAGDDDYKIGASLTSAAQPTQAAARLHKTILSFHPFCNANNAGRATETVAALALAHASTAPCGRTRP